MTAILQRVSTDRPAQPSPNVVVVAVRGEVDSCTGQLMRDRLLEHVRPAGPQLVIDLTEVTFFGAAGLTVLVTTKEAAAAAGIRLCVVAHTRPVLLPLTITGLDTVLDIYPGVAHALALMGGPDG